jgi:hypothetical protein
MKIKQYLEEDKKMDTTSKNTIMMYNVLNLWSSEDLVDKTIKDVYNRLKPGQILMVNYPKTPRASKLSAKDIENKLKKSFRSVMIVGGEKDTPFFRCEK